MNRATKQRISKGRRMLHKSTTFRKVKSEETGEETVAHLTFKRPYRSAKRAAKKGLSDETAFVRPPR